jgi:regulator of cell morphogenesis and NO signaling
MIFLHPLNTIGRLVEEHPQYIRVFDRFHVDYGFAGSLTLAEACLRHGLDLQELLGQLREADRESAILDETVLEDLGPPELIEYILFTHHHYLEREMPRLEDLFTRALETLDSEHPEILEWLALFRRFRWTMERHMKKEGRELFPLCLSMPLNSTPEQWAQVLDRHLMELEKEDEEILARLKQLRNRTDGYEVPEASVSLFRFLLYDLNRFEVEVKRHLRVESEILFPKVRATPPARTSDRRPDASPSHP